MYIYIYIYICTHIYIYIYIYICRTLPPSLPTTHSRRPTSHQDPHQWVGWRKKSRSRDTLVRVWVYIQTYARTYMITYMYIYICIYIQEEGNKEERPTTRPESNTAYCILHVIQSQFLILNLIGLFSMERQK